MLSRSRITSHVFILLILLAGGSRVHALLAPDYDFTKALSNAELVVEGRVLDTQAEWVDSPNGKNIYTTVRMSVDRVMKGENKDKELVFSVMGGIVGNLTQTVSDLPSFHAGDSAFVLLSSRNLSNGLRSPVPGFGKIPKMNERVRWAGSLYSAQEFGNAIESAQAGIRTFDDVLRAVPTAKSTTDGHATSSPTSGTLNAIVVAATGSFHDKNDPWPPPIGNEPTIPDGGGWDNRVNLQINCSGVPSNAKITNVRYSIGIRHPWRGDLCVDLTAYVENSRWVSHAISNHRGGDADNIYESGSFTTFNGGCPNYTNPDPTPVDATQFNPNGEWYLVAWDDAAGDEGRIDFFEIWIDWETAQPDLTKSTDNLSQTEAHPGDTLTATLTVTNTGTASAGSSSYVYYYWKKDSYVYSDEYKVGEDYVPDLGIGVPSDESYSFIIPAGSSPGTYYLYYWIDATENVTEISEDNNRYYWTVTVTDPVPTISNVSPTQGSAGTNTQVTITGSCFGVSRGSGKVEFWYGGVRSGDPERIEADIASWTDTQIVCKIPVAEVNGYSASACSGPLRVTNDAGAISNERTFIVTFSYMGRKWIGDTGDIQVRYRINENCADCTGEGASVMAGAITWVNAGAGLSFVYDGTHTNTDVGSNGQNEIMWSNSIPFGVLARSTSWSSGEAMSEADIAFNDFYAWSADNTLAGNEYDIQSIISHELGHWLSLRDLYGDIGDGENDNGKVMYGIGSPGVLKRSLHLSDISGILYIYSDMPSPNVSVTAPDASASESGDTGYFRITRTGNMFSSLNVYYTMSGSASGSDYSLNDPSPATIPEYYSYVDVVLTAEDDSAVEETENATLTISTNSAYNRVSPYAATINIADNDQLQYPDLCDRAESYRSFSPSTIHLNEPFEIHCDIENAGGSASGPFVVKFYASSQTSIIAGPHYYLGEKSMNSIPAGSYADCDWSDSFHSDESVPDGEYYIGWRIDPDNTVQESNDTNNEAYKEGYTLTFSNGDGWVLNPQNGHYYRAFPETRSWGAAKAAAEAMSYNGWPGHLATITSTQENEWIRTNLSLGNQQPYWIGSTQSAKDQEPAGRWIWVTGETWDYTDWEPGEPNNNNGNQDCLQYLGGAGTWYDTMDSVNQGYIVECEPQPTGSIVAWGENGNSQCNVPSPNADFVALAAGWAHSLGLKADGLIVAWGTNSYDQCTVPSPNSGFVAVTTGNYHSVGLKADGSVVAWGLNTDGQCTVPSPNSGFVAVEAGSYHTLGLKSDGSVVAWGANTDGQCTVPSPNSDFVAVTAGYHHSGGLKSDGSIVAWGLNTSGQCTVPGPNSGFMAVTAGYFHTVGLKSDGSVITWGDNVHGQCTAPVPNTNFVSVAAGRYHNVGLKSDGSIVTWGDNGSNQCDIPVPNTDFFAVAAGVSHSLALTANFTPPPEWVLNPQNGHYYRVFTEVMSWNTAKAAAETMICNGWPGHLATVTSAEENAWILTNLSLGTGGTWIGGLQSPSGAEPAGGWGWITGETWSYTDWSPGEPNEYHNQQEDYLQYFGNTRKWGDAKESTNLGYIVECEPNISSVEDWTIYH